MTDYSATPSDRLDVREYVRPILSRWWLIVLVVGIATTATYLHYNREPKVYESSTLVFVRSSDLQEVLIGGSQNINERDLANLATLVTSAPVARRVATDLNFRGDPRALLGAVNASAASSSDFITITAQGNRPRATAELANAFASAFINLQSQDRRQDAQAAMAVARQQLRRLGAGQDSADQRKQLNDRLQRLQALSSRSASASGLQQLNRAVPPVEALSPKPRRNAIFAFIVSLALAIGAAFGLERLDRRIKRVDDVGAAFETDVLGEIPRIRHPAPIADGHGDLPEAFREPFRSLRTLLGLKAADHPIRTLLVTSAAPREGKSTVARNLAVAYREAGWRVLLVDSDLRRPSIDQLLPVEREPGLTEVLIGTRQASEAVQAVAVRAKGLEELAEARSADTNGNGNGTIGELAVLTSGHRPPNPLELLSTTRMRTVLEELATEHDIVIIDSPPLLAVSDAVALMTAVDGVLLVARTGTTTTDAADRVRAELARVPEVRLLGVVANGVAGRRLQSRAYGGYYTS